MTTYKCSPAEQKLLKPLHDEITYLLLAQAAVPIFSVALSSVLLEAGIRSLALAVVQGEALAKQDGRADELGEDFRSRQLEHLLAMLGEAYTRELKMFDTRPDLLKGLQAAATTVAGILKGAPRS